MTTITQADLQKIAIERSQLHKNHSSRRALSANYDYVGLSGEVAFGNAFDMPVDLTKKPGGDNHVDFYTPIGTVDVKTYRKAFNLLREENKKHAKILVLAAFNESTQTAVLVGWEYDTEMLKQPKKDFGYGIVNYFKSARLLRPMGELKKLMEQARNGSA